MAHQATTAEPRLSGRVALVTGGGSGMGRACALALAAEGASLAVLGRTGATLEEVAGLARAAGAEALAVVGDVASADDARAARRGGRGALRAARRAGQQRRHEHGSPQPRRDWPGRR